MARGTSMSMELMAFATTVAIAVVCVAAMGFWRGLFTAINVAAFACYGFDKFRVVHGGRRVPEAALHVLAAAGGTPGAFVGQVLFRHKTRDRRFRVVFFAIAAVQVVGLLMITHLRSS